MSSANPALPTSSAVPRIRRTAALSRPCARVIGIRCAISLTCALSCSTRRRNTSLRGAERLRIVEISSAVAGTTSTNSGTNCGTRIAVRISAPISVKTAEVPAWLTCCSICSTFSTSRTSFVCSMLPPTRLWKPIDSRCRCRASVERTSMPRRRMIALDRRTHRMCIGMFCSSTTASRIALIQRPRIGLCDTTTSMMLAVSTGSSQVGLSLTTKVAIAPITRPRSGRSKP